MSKNAAAIILMALSLFGIEIPEESVVNAISGVVAILSLAMMIWNQLERKDVSLFFWKK